MKNNEMSRGVKIAVAAATLGLAACGGGGGGDSAPQLVSISGVVADGYLNGATVCLDINENYVCDAGEPTDVSGAGGAYQFDAAQGDVNTHSVIAEAGPSTIDEDTGNYVATPYTLVAPAGRTDFISPLTTMVKYHLEIHPGLSVDDAEAAVKATLGYAGDSNISLYADYIKNENDSSNPNAGDYERLHMVAQVSAELLATNLAAAEQVAMDAGIPVADNYDALLGQVAGGIYDGLGMVADNVDTVIADAAGTYTLEQAKDDAAAAIDPGVDSSNIGTLVDPANVPMATSFAEASANGVDFDAQWLAGRGLRDYGDNRGYGFNSDGTGLLINNISDDASIVTESFDWMVDANGNLIITLADGAVIEFALAEYFDNFRYSGGYEASGLDELKAWDQYEEFHNLAVEYRLSDFDTMNARFTVLKPSLAEIAGRYTFQVDGVVEAVLEFFADGTVNLYEADAQGNLPATPTAPSLVWTYDASTGVIEIPGIPVWMVMTDISGNEVTINMAGPDDGGAAGIDFYYLDIAIVATKG